MLASVLVVLCLVLLLAEFGARGRGRYARVDSGAARPAALVALGRARWAACGDFAALIGLALGLPLGTLAYWAASGGSAAEFDLGALASATASSLELGLGAALIGTQTLATQFWAKASTLSYGAASPYGAMMIVISALPTYLLTRRGAGAIASRDR